MLTDTVNQMLEMAELFKAHGQTELYRSAKETATKLCDYILFVETYQPNSEACRNAEIARSETLSVCTRGELKPNGQHGCVGPRTSCRGGATATMRLRNASACALASSFVRGSMTLYEGERHPRSKKPKQYLPPLVAWGGASHPSIFDLNERSAIQDP